MGAESFITKAAGKTAAEAFSAAAEQARWEHGHGGYTGTIAEKHEFVMIDVPQGIAPRAYINELLNAGDERINNKWGPAGCIDAGDGTFLFFGWASS